MNDYILDRETLGGFVDELMKQKRAKVNSPMELNELREKNIRELDDRIGEAVFSKLDDDHLKQVRILIEKDNGNEKVFQRFFVDNNIDLQQIITDTMNNYANEFLGVQNV